ncbi:host specificity protein J, partial [Escherichia coli]
MGIDAAEFKNEIPRIKNLLNGAASDAERSSARMQRFMERQTQAARQTMQAASSAATAASVHAQTVEKSAQAHERMAREVEQTRQRMEALSQKMREEQAQAMALAEAQDKAAAAFYRQIDSVKQASAGLQELQRIQQQIRQARNSGGIGQQDYLALISEVTAKTRVLTQAEEESTRQKVAFIRQLKEQATRQNLSSSELLRARAAQLGVSSAAEVYIRKMEQAGKATHSLGLKSAAARQEIGVLIGELARGNLGALRGSGITLATRTITSANIDRLRFTFGVQALVETTSKGDRNPSEVRLLVQIQRNGGWVTEKDITIKGKTTSQYLASVVVDNLPPRPFNIRMRRMTPDSTTDQLQNKTLWSSYTEIIDVQQCYPNTALVGVQVDSEQFGSQQVSRNYHLRGRILQVPSNYDPEKRTYSGIWDGTLKPAYSNNMAWCLWDMLTHPRYGMGKRLGAADVDKWALYVIGQYCDQSVPDGSGGTEPRITCNAWLTTQRKAWDVLSDFCSAMRCMPVWNGQTLTFVQDRPSDKVWTYNRSNVVMPDDGAPFRYSFSALKDRHNAVEVNWTDPDNGWETATELVEDTQAIARYGRNVTKMDAFGCTSRGQAHRAGLWLIKTELLETQTVDFSVGAEGLRHVPGDVIEICDDDYAGISTGGRVLAVNSQTRTLTLDREITLPSSGTTLISLVDGSGNPVSVEVQSVTDGVKVKVSRVPDGVAEYSVWGLKLPTLRQRLFRCVSIRENDDGTYAITAVQHVPEKEAIVDNGAHFDGDQSGTVNGVTPPAVQHLTAEVTADSGEYQVLARWDTPKVVKGVSFLLRLTVAADDGSERLVSTARTTETTYRFTQLAPGNYRLTVRAVNAWGQQGDPASVSFRIAAPAAPSQIELTPGYFQITATPHLAVYDPTVQFEFWFSETRIADIRQVETSARYLGTALYWIAASSNIKPGYDYYFYIRSVNTVGKSAFVEAVGRASDDAEGYLDFFKGQITESHLGKELLEKVELTEDNASKLEEFSKEW